MKRVLSDMTGRDWIWLIAISLLVAFCGVFGVSYVVGRGWPVLELWAELSLTVLFTGIVAVLFLLADAAMGKGLATPKAATCGRTVLDVLTPRLTAGSVAIFSAVMAVLWTPWFIANYPGGTYWDTYYQIFQVYPENHPIAIIPWAEIYKQTLTDAWLVDHHPVLTTLVYGAFGWASDQLTGNWMAGVAAFCILQGLAHVVAFTTSVAYLRKVGCPKLLCLIAYVFFAIMPFISTWAMCMVKDSTFGLFCVPYFMMLFETVRTHGEFLSREPGGLRNAVLFAICALMLCLTKKTGIFVVVPTCLIGAWLFRQGSAPVPDRMQPVFKPNHGARNAFLAQAAATTLVMLVVLPLVVFPAANILPGGKQEILGPLFQQTARTIVDYPSDVTPQERKAISAVLDYDKLADQYSFDFEDSVKYRYNLDATAGDIAAYLQAYFSMGLRHPDSCFGALMSLAGFYVAPDAFINIRMVTVDTKMGPDQRYMLWNPDELADYRHFLDDTYQAIGKIPVLDIPLLIVTYALWLPALLIYLAKRRRIACGLVFVPALVLLAFCVIAPVYDARYVVPILDMAPLLFCAFIVLERGKVDSACKEVFSQDSEPSGDPMHVSNGFFHNSDVSR